MSDISHVIVSKGVRFKTIMGESAKNTDRVSANDIIA
jgi:hypothetical protein